MGVEYASWFFAVSVIFAACSFASSRYRLSSKVQRMYQDARAAKKQKISPSRYIPDDGFRTFLEHVESNNVYQVRLISVLQCITLQKSKNGSLQATTIIRTTRQSTTADTPSLWGLTLTLPSTWRKLNLKGYKTRWISFSALVVIH